MKDTDQTPTLALLDEASLTMSRQKPRSAVVSAAYRLGRFCDALLGRRRMLRFYLNAERLFWRFAFERSGAVYGNEFHNRTKALDERFLQHWVTKDDSVIDIGCGLGRWCEIASKYAGTVVGIDYSGELVAEAKRRNKAPNVEFVVGDVTRDLGDRRFDLAVMTHVLEHIDEPDKFLADLRSVARRLIVEVPDIESDPLDLVRISEGCQFYSDGDHVREYTDAILNDQLERNGWRVLENRRSGGAVLAVAELAGRKSNNG